MGREIRHVPAGWKHPKDRRGNYIPLHDQTLEEALESWRTDGANPEDEPNPKYYRAAFGAPADCFQIYETVSEGTPVSPLFADKSALIGWLIDQGHSQKAAARFAEMEWVPSMIMFTTKAGERKIVMGIDSAAID